MIKEKIPGMFLHACTMSGHGFHFYISVEPLVKNMHRIIEANKKLASLTGAVGWKRADTKSVTGSCYAVIVSFMKLKRKIEFMKNRTKLIEKICDVTGIPYDQHVLS